MLHPLMSSLAFFDPMVFSGKWISDAVGAFALFGIFLPVVIWTENRRKEREAYYKAETMRRLAETSADGAHTVMEMMRETQRLEQRKTREGLKIGGLITLAVGVALMIFLHALLGPDGPDHGQSGPVYLCGLIPALIGLAMLIYVFFLSPRSE
jgi:hypothetical protein